MLLILYEWCTLVMLIAIELFCREMLMNVCYKCYLFSTRTCLNLPACRLTDVGSTRMWPTRPGWTAQTSFSQEPTNGHWTNAWHWSITTAATSPFTLTMCKYPTRGLTPAASRPITSPVSPTSTSSSKVRRWVKMVNQWRCVKTANLFSHLHDITTKIAASVQ